MNFIFAKFLKIFFASWIVFFSALAFLPAETTVPDALQGVWHFVWQNNQMSASLVSVGPGSDLGEEKFASLRGRSGATDVAIQSGSDDMATGAESAQDVLDDIAEKLDLIQEQINQLKAQQNPEVSDKEKEEANDEKEDSEDQEDESDEQEQNQIEKINYPQILISEAKALPISQRFVRLYNPNSEKVDLSGWYLQRKINSNDPWDSFVSKNYFEGKIIAPNGYFLISRQLAWSDIVLDITLGENNLLALKNPNGEISCEFFVPQNQTVNSGGGGSGGSAPAVYPEILISEVKISEQTGDNNIFLELYNPGDSAISLSGWYVFRNGTSFIAKEKLQGKTIPANGYFLASREESLWAGQSIVFSDTLNSNDKISLKDPNGDVKDELEWTTVGAGKSLGRKWNGLSEQDTGSDVDDFELQVLTPGLQNEKWVEPVIMDENPPSVVFDLPAIQTQLSFGVNFTISDILETTSSGVAGYIFRWSDNYISEEEITWQEDPVIIIESGGAPSSPDGSDYDEFSGVWNFPEDYVLQDGQTYYFQIMAFDATGNPSGWVEAQTKVEAPKNMLSNEFFDQGWEGTSLAGNPIDWFWGKRGGIELEEYPLVEAVQSFYHKPYSDPYYLKQLSKILEAGQTYYVEVWASGTGKIKAGIEIAGEVIEEPTFYVPLVDADWTKIDFFYTIAEGEETSEGGVAVKLTRYNSTDERLIIGAVWLGTTEPPDGWPVSQ